jgi:hypothetical protein
MTQDTISQAAGEYMLALKSAKLAYEKLELDLTPEALNAGAATILIHATKINANGHSAPRPASGDPYANPGDVLPAVCKECGGDIWDNRGNKKNPKGPDWKCKEASCGAAAWLNKDGSVTWKA